MQKPKLRDGKKRISNEPYSFSQIPSEIIYKLGAYFVYLLYIGRKDISGSDFGDAFAKAVGGAHLDSPVGIADIVFDKMAWSAKTVKNIDPFKCANIRLISGRCSPDYSYGITDPHSDIEKTGRAVLEIYNERINIAYDSYNAVRSVVLVRSLDLLSYTLFEIEAHRYRSSDYEWAVNPNGNLIGKHKESGKICFTWQPHGSQFTIHESVPQNAIKFKIKQPPIITQEDILKTLKFDETWVEILKMSENKRN